MSYTVKEVARMSGVSVRTLHHYDEIGLLKPARYGANGYRYYEREQLLRLQQILFLRELEMPLDDIHAALERDAIDRVEALTAHRRLLQEKAERLNRLLLTVDRTIEHLKGARAMREAEFFEGFDRKRAEQVKKELHSYFGDAEGAVREPQDDPFEQSLERTKGWGKTDYADVKRQYDDIHRAMTDLLEQGAAADSDEAQAVVSRHYATVRRFYDPTKEMYAGLGSLYVEHPEFRMLYDSYHPQLAGYMRDAMQRFAEREL